MRSFLLSLLLSVVAVFAPIRAMLVTALVLTLADLVVGVIAAARRGERITSNGFRRTAVKIFVYESGLALGFLAERYLLGSALPAGKLIAAVVGLIELKSVLENLNSIYGTNLFQELLAKLNGPKVDK